MGVNFDALVLRPTLATFGVAFTWFPKASAPGADPVDVQGVYSSSVLHIEMADGQTFSDQQTTMGIKLADWPWPPKRGDRLLHHDSAIMYWVAESMLDGQGGATLQLRLTEPEGDL